MTWNFSWVIYRKFSIGGTETVTYANVRIDLSRQYGVLPFETVATDELDTAPVPQKWGWGPID